MRHDLAKTHHRNAVGGGQNFAQFVSDQNDRDATFPERVQDVEQPVCFLRCQDAGRFVQYQDTRPAHQCLQYLDPLLLADRKIANNGIRVDFQSVIMGKPGQFRPRCALTRVKQCATLGAEHDILKHAHGIDQHEMLVHHTDAKIDCCPA